MEETPGSDARLHLRIDPAISRRLRIACVKRDFTLSEAVQDAVELWLSFLPPANDNDGDDQLEEVN